MNPGDVAIYNGPNKTMIGATMVVTKTDIPDYINDAESTVKAAIIGNEYTGVAWYIKKENLKVYGNITQIKSEVFKILSGEY